MVFLQMIRIKCRRMFIYILFSIYMDDFIFIKIIYGFIFSTYNLYFLLNIKKLR